MLCDINNPDRYNMYDSPFLRLGSEGDMQKIPPTQARDALASAGIGEGELDLLAAGPPCQGFSHVGRSKLDSLVQQRGAFQHDKRNRLYLSVTRLLPVLQPRCFLIENVPGIMTHARVNVAERIAEKADEAGYRSIVAVLNAAWYGVPQTRERVFILGYREDLGLEPTFPVPTRNVKLTSGHLAGAPWVANLFTDRQRLIVLDNPGPDVSAAVTVADAIGDFPPFTRHLENGYRSGQMANRRLEYPNAIRPGSYGQTMRRWPKLPESAEVRDHYTRATPRDYETFRQMQPGDRYPEAIRVARKRYAEALLAHRSMKATSENHARPLHEDFVPPYPIDSFKDKWRKLIPTLPSWTVTAHLSRDGYSHIHYDSEQARSISPREAARLQSFPDAFRFAGNMGDTFRQIGNAVPPLLARDLGRHIAMALRTADGCEGDALEEEPQAPLPIIELVNYSQTQ